MKHVLHGSEEAPCPYDRCFICETPVVVCMVCGGYEAALPNECPGRRLTGKEMNRIQAGILDWAEILA